MKRLAIAAVGLGVVVALLVHDGTLVQAQPVASIVLPSPGSTMQLYSGCNNIALTFPDGTASENVMQAVTPAGAVEAMWHYNAAQSKFEAFSSAAPQASDLLSVNFLDAVWLCVSGAPSATATPAPGAATATPVPPTATATPPSGPTATPVATTVAPTPTPVVTPKATPVVTPKATPVVTPKATPVGPTPVPTATVKP